MIINKYEKKKQLTFRDKFLNLFSSLTPKQRLISKLTQRALRTDGLDKRLFSAVEIETVNRCNGKCAFCPVSAGNDQREYHKMSEDLFQKIILQLERLDYKGNLALFSNNEPFLDQRIENFAVYARQHLPNAFIYLYTNASLLSLERYKKIIGYLDEMIIDNYNDSLELNPNVQIINEFIQDKENIFEKTKIHLRKEHEVLFSRGGNAPNKQNAKTLKMSCILPFTQLIIRPDGKISLCSNDAYGEMTLGDATEQSLKEIWFGDKCQEVRKALRKGRKNNILCRHCDSTFYPGQFGIRVKGDKR